MPERPSLLLRVVNILFVLTLAARSLLPAGQESGSAELAVNVTSQSGQFGKTLVASNVNTFDPTKVTYANAPLIYNPGAAVAVPNAVGGMAFDVASQVTAWDAAGAQAAEDMGNLAISAAGPGGRVVMDSMETFQSQPATLKITYKIVD